MRAALCATAISVALAIPAPAAAQRFVGHWTTDDGATGRQGEHTVELDVWREASGQFAGTATYFLKGSTARVCTTGLRQRAVDTLRAVPQLGLVESGCGGGVVTLTGSGNEGLFSRGGGAPRPGTMEQFAVRTGPAVRAASSAIPVSRSSGPRPQALQLGRAVRGRLQQGDPVASDRTLYDDYTFTASAPTRVRITMRAAEFDAYLIAGIRGNPRGVQDDDSGGGTDARVEMEVPAGGTLVIRANALGQGMQGEYTLELTEG